MYADLRASGERPPEPPRRRPLMTSRQERWALRLVIVVPLAMLVAPFAGGTMVQAVMAAFGLR